MGWDGASLASLTSWPVIQPTHTHTTLTIRMHFNFPPCCVHTHRTTYYIAEGGHGRESATSSSSSSSNCCKSAKPQMLSVTQKSTLSSPSLLHTYPTNHPSNKPTAKCSLPFLSLPFPRCARTRCRRQSSSICLPSIMAAHCGITELPVGTRGGWGREGGRLRRLRAIANKKGGKSTLLWHLILILLPYLSIDSGDCRGIR